MLIKSIHRSLDKLTGLLNQLSENEYSNSCPALSNASIGEHTRHILEMFQCLENSYELGILNYDNRARDKRIQTDTAFAMQTILEVKKGLKTENKIIYLEQIIDGLNLRIQSNYYRELLYNLEHCIHHQALIKVAVLQCENVSIDENFGVAGSTIEHRKQCVQ
ncbi:DinB family protein [Flavobacterium sp. Fl-77]|uniref:DinB family protein n=1 Tax=Flavobacterium flavipigmentatum TaxID=2893884 RepID=A0AAJ2SF84_9FLAO|nr:MULTISPECIES: DinB family protein [unclassified Flavobacterium]MDX6182082.1 DinB family protein [Flavobacterium sp. Fl-33]MDX6186005.1 DinB family protein [Flavobacterium sp. Fl-77]UFH39180.1 DinB family protein [Flavobacterium sp. F-70]